MTPPIPLDPAAPLRSLREAACLTQADLAERLGCAQPTVATGEADGARVRVERVLRVAEACGLEVALVASEKKKAKKRT